VAGLSARSLTIESNDQATSFVARPRVFGDLTEIISVCDVAPDLLYILIEPRGREVTSVESLVY
jgi:hypothetical protein